MRRRNEHLVVISDDAVLADVDAMLETELVGDPPLRTLAEAHR